MQRRTQKIMTIKFPGTYLWSLGRAIFGDLVVFVSPNFLVHFEPTVVALLFDTILSIKIRATRSAPFAPTLRFFEWLTHNIYQNV